MSTYDHQWRRVRARVLQDAQACHLCGGALDFDAPPRSPNSPSVDHIFSVRAMRGMDAETRQRLLLDPANLRPACFGCNSQRGDGRRDKPKHTSREWL
jgi:5-methylcytosine-specific restriction endonuclease McrA